MRRWTVALSKLAKQASLVISTNVLYFPHPDSQVSHTPVRGRAMDGHTPVFTDVEARILNRNFEAEWSVLEVM